MTNKFTAIILAGGRSSRMGSDKALVPYLGKPLISYPVGLALRFTEDIIISTNNHDLDFLGFRVVNDEYRVKAPLAGVHAGLKSSHSEWNLVLTCDMPHVTGVVVERLLQELDDDLRLVLPQHDGFTEPLCGFYHRGLLPLIEENMALKRFSLLDLPAASPHRFVNMQGMSPDALLLLFKNVNEKKDLLI